jgi:hypothetical protein
MELDALNSHKKRKFKPRVMNTTTTSTTREDQNRGDTESNPELRRIIPR